MAKIKLELKTKTDNEVRDLADNHKEALDGNPHFTTPAPTALVFDGKLTAYSGKLGDIAQAEIALGTLRSEKDVLRKEMETLLTARASYVEDTSLGDAAKILSAGFEIQSDGTPTTSLPQPQNLIAKTGKNGGEIVLSCAAVKRAKTYVWECREHVEGQPPGPWVACRISSGSKTTAAGLVSGKRYAFRVRALGPNDVQSPWSDEAVAMAA